MNNAVKRVTTAILIMLVVIGMLVLNNQIVYSIFVTLLAIVGMYECNRVFKAKEHHPIPGVGYLSCLIIPLLGNVPTDLVLNVVLVALPCLILYTFAYIIFKKLEVTVIDVAITFLTIIYSPFMFAFVKLLLAQTNGRIFLLLAIAYASATDTFAYEIGSRFGKHKLCPIVSPKKSIEGSIAGIIASVVISVAICAITNTYFNTSFNLIIMGVMGVVFSIIGQIGDLAASSIKRYCGEKDFSQLLPGHGGVLDRLDSILFISPFLYIFLYLCNLL